MLTQGRIEEVRRQVQVSTMDAMHALSMTGGDVARAVEELNGHSTSSTRPVIVKNRLQAQRLAAALVESGIWFECEATVSGEHRFSVAPVRTHGFGCCRITPVWSRKRNSRQSHDLRARALLDLLSSCSSRVLRRASLQSATFLIGPKPVRPGPATQYPSRNSSELAPRHKPARAKFSRAERDA